MSTKRRGKKETKQEPPTQYRVIYPVSLADLENIHTRKGKYPTKPPPLGQATWEDAKREKGERLRKAKKERPLSTPLETTSTDAMDTKEAQEFNTEIAAKATEKELRKQRYVQYQQKRQQTTGYDFPRPGSIPIPQLEKFKEKREPRPQSVLILTHPIMKKYPCTVRDHLPGQGPSQLHHWSQTKKRKHRGLGQKSLPVMYQPFKTIPPT